VALVSFQLIMKTRLISSGDLIADEVVPCKVLFDDGARHRADETDAVRSDVISKKSLLPRRQHNSDGEVRRACHPVSFLGWEN